MKIIIFSHLFPNPKYKNYGIFNYSRAKSLIKLGYEVLVISPVSLNPHMEFIFPKLKIVKQYKLLSNLLSIPAQSYYEGVKVHYPKWLKFPDKYFFKYHSDIMHLFIGRKINKIIKVFNPDFILSTWLNPYGTYSKYIENKNIPYFALSEGDDGLIHPFKYKGWKRIERAINQNCTEVIAVSNRMNNQLKKKTGFKIIKTIRNGYDEEIFYFKQDVKAKVEGPVKIISVANFYHVKGHDLLLEALRSIKIKVKLTLVGAGPLIEECKNIVTRNGLDEKVEFLGSLPHNMVAQSLRDNDIFCLPSRSEGLPGAPLEAMACGLPVVAFDVGGLNEIIIDGFNGFLCKPESVDDLAEKLTIASQKKWDYYEISRWVKDNYSWGKWAENIIHEYKNI